MAAISGNPSVITALERIPKESGLVMPEPPPGMANRNQFQALNTGDEYMLDGAIRKIKMGLGWDKVNRAGCDMDGSCVMMDSNKQVQDIVWYQQLVSRCKSIKHSGDDTTGDGGGDDEVIKVALDKVPLHIHYLLFMVCVYSPRMSFADVKTCYVRLMHRKKMGKNPELARLALGGGPGEAMLLCCIVRKGSWWSMVTLGHPVAGRTAPTVMQNPAQLSLVHSITSFFPQLKLVTITVVSAKGLAVKDMSLFGGSSDPFYTVKYSGFGGKRGKIFVKSETKQKSLDPVWRENPIQLGYIHPSDHKLVKIRVWDEDMATDPDFMGEVRIPAAMLWNLQVPVQECWFPLSVAYNKPGEEKISNTKNVKGKLLIRIAAQPVQ